MRHPAIFALSFTVALIATGASVVAAKWVRRSGYDCFSINADPYGRSGPDNANGDAGSMEAFCPFPESDYLRKHDVKSLNIHGYNGGFRARGQACMGFWDADDGACGTLFYDTARNYVLKPDLTLWGSEYASDFGYMEVSVSGRGGSVRGYYAKDN